MFCVLQLTSVSQITPNNDVAERVGQHEICALRRCHLKSIAALAYSRENLDSGQYTLSALLKLRVERPSLALVPLYTVVLYGTHGWSSPRSHTETQTGLAVLAHGIHRKLATSPSHPHPRPRPDDSSIICAVGSGLWRDKSTEDAHRRFFLLTTTTCLWEWLPHVWRLWPATKLQDKDRH